MARFDAATGITPDVDLRQVDIHHSISRRHAKIYCEDDRFFVVEDIGATNGTFVEDSRIRTGVPVDIEHGVTVRFGLVELHFLVE